MLAVLAGLAQAGGYDFTGSDDVDSASGTDQQDVMSGGGGADYLRGLGGGDRLDGEDGEDTLIGDEPGDAAADEVNGGSGNDELAGGDGPDWISGGAGNDLIGSLDFRRIMGPLTVEAGDDELSGDDGDDIIYAGPGDDTVLGGAGRDNLFGGDGADSLDGGDGGDTLFGEAGDDLIKARDGAADEVHCGPGDDVVEVDRLDTVASDCETVNWPATPPGDDPTTPPGGDPTTPPDGDPTTPPDGDPTTPPDGDPDLGPRASEISLPGKASLSGNALRLTVGCPGELDAACAGKLTVKTAEVVRSGGSKHHGGKHHGHPGHHDRGRQGKGKGKVLKLGSSPFEVPSGESAKVKIKIARKARKALSKLHRIALKATVKLSGVSGPAARATSRISLKISSSHKGGRAGKGHDGGRRTLSWRSQGCSDGWVTQAVFEVTGNTAIGYACLPSLYHGGHWSSYAELKGYVSQVMSVCGANPAGRNLTQAMIELAGAQPSSASSPLCNQPLQEQGNDRGCSSGCTNINWSVYKDRDYEDPVHGGNLSYGETSVWQGVAHGLNQCTSNQIAAAAIEETGARPDDRGGENSPGQWPDELTSSQTFGQCHPYLYGSGAAYDSTFAQVKAMVHARAASTQACSDAWITQAYQELSGWKPLAYECNKDRYGGGTWGSYPELKRRVAASLRCSDPWIGQVYLFDLGRAPRGRGSAGECNPGLYGGGQWGSYDDLRTKVGVTEQALRDNGLEFHIGGDLDANGVRVDAAQVLIGSPVFSVDPAGGNVIAPGGGNVIAPGGGNVIANGGGNVIAPGGGNLLSDKGAGLINLAGGSVIAPGGANVIAAGAGNVIAPGGGNVIANGGLN